MHRIYKQSISTVVVICTEFRQRTEFMYQGHTEKFAKKLACVKPEICLFTNQQKVLSLPKRQRMEGGQLKI